MKLFLLFCICWIVKSSTAQCTVCDSTNRQFTGPQAPKEWLEFIKDPQKIDKRKYDYVRRLQVELDISKEGKITGYQFLKVFKNNALDSDMVEAVIKLSPLWIPAKICNYPLQTKYAVEIYTKPLLVDPTDCCSDYFTLVYNNPLFPGGTKAWNQFLLKNIKNRIVLNNNETNDYCKNAILKFMVNKEGLLVDIKILNEINLHPLQIKLINKIIQIPTKWIPGEINGRKVSGTFVEVIQFELVNIPFS